VVQASLELGEPDRLLRWEPECWPLAAGWAPVVGAFLASDTGRRLGDFLQHRIDAGAVIYPPHPLRALELTPLADVHAVILGQDPYHGPGQAEGLAFSVPPGVAPPPSLRNIFKELQVASPSSNGSLRHWARQGVLLLNTCLTVEQGQAGSHAKKGWEAFTDAVLAEVAAHASPCVYLLWGAHAQAKAPMVCDVARRHGREALVLQANHPSPLSASRPPVPFIGCGHFAQARAWLAERGHPGFFTGAPA
jgi:uracil-DNA glycosylase